jgi:hypothetical protein
MAVKDYKASTNPKDMANVIATQLNRLQFGVLEGVDYICRRFEEALRDKPEMLAEIERVKAELVARPVMQVVNAIRAESQTLRLVANGKITFSKEVK